jgi:NADH-quinone oxidoreductase subunit H
LFLGGWRMSWPVTAFWPGANEGWWPVLWFLGKMFVFLFVFIWLRGTLPRLRYDQFMRFGWKVLIPTSIVWLLVVATFRQLRNAGDLDRAHAVPLGIGIAALFVLAVVALEIRERNQIRRTPAPTIPDYEPLAGGFPVPPMPGQSAPPPPRRPQFARTAAPALALNGSTAEEANTDE